MKRNTTFTRVTNISASVYEEARRRANDNPVFENSHRREEANEVGCLGEVIAEYWMRHHGIAFTSQLNETTHDYKLENGKSFDVKTKDRTVRPRHYYDCSVPMYNHNHQKSDYFLFITLERNSKDKSCDITRYHTANIVGSISYEELDRVGIKFLKGERDERNKTKFWTDCLNIEMWQLVPNLETIEIFKGQREYPSRKADINVHQINEMKAQIANNEIKDRDFPTI